MVQQMYKTKNCRLHRHAGGAGGGKADTGFTRFHLLSANIIHTGYGYATPPFSILQNDRIAFAFLQMTSSDALALINVLILRCIALPCLSPAPQTFLLLCEKAFSAGPDSFQKRGS